MEIENGKISHEFIPFAKRQLHEVNVDISGCNATTEIAERIKDALEDVLQQDMVRVILTGEIAMGSERNLSYLQEKFSNDYYAFSVKDKSVLKIEPSDFKNDVSLKGEFIRLCMEQPLEEEQKRKVIELGIHALLGEEL